MRFDGKRGHALRQIITMSEIALIRRNPHRNSIDQ